MFAVTVVTARRHRVAARGGLAVQASFLFRCAGLVAGAAINQLEVPACRMTTLIRIEVTVAVHARQVGVHRCAIGGRRDVHRHFLTGAGARELRVAVTIEAIVVALGRSEGGCEQQAARDGDKPTLSMTTMERSETGWALARTQDGSLYLGY